MSSGRKRVVSSCVPCYTRKQKCNRQYPCNNCARRRCPEECAYYPSTASQTSKPPERRREEIGGEKERRGSCSSLNLRKSWVAPALSSSHSILAELFGYSEESDGNTLALVRKASRFSLGLGASDSSPTVPVEAADEVHRHMEQMPDRPILDFLIRYFVAEVNWMDHLVHPPWFLARYQRWWAVERVTLVMEVDFAVLILRICSYASHFLPSPSYTLDKIRGVMLSEIRNTCDEVAESLAAISSACDGRGSLIRVQHLAFLSLQCQMEGRRDAFWDALSRAIRVAQGGGIHSGAAKARPGVDGLEKEMERRTFCNLYTWDSLLSRQLDRPAFLPAGLIPANWPQMHLGGGGGAEAENGDGESGGDRDRGRGRDRDRADLAAAAPESFTERLLQARLADFWRRISTSGGEYDMMVAEERYARFCREYLAELPPAFALQPAKAWDKRLPKLPLQRQLLHITIYNSLCWNFRPLLLHFPYEQNLPAYKRMLLDSQKKALVIAALHVLEGVSQLHAMLGGCHTRFAGLVFSTFEAAVLLVCLCVDPLFLNDGPPQVPPLSTNIKNSQDPDPLRTVARDVSRQKCIEAVQDALDRLRMLAEVSNIADVGASTLAQLLSRASTTTTTDEVSMSQNQPAAGDIVSCPSLDPSDSNSQDGSISTSQTSAAVGEKTTWPSFHPSDLNSQDDFMMESKTTTAMGEITSWPSFDPSDVNSQDHFISLSATQELNSNWATPMIDLSCQMVSRDHWRTPTDSAVSLD
ncbi:hypothetical protein BJ875DRAFT_423692 [Amylocarpus encephaloides]|uniref:Zn(2)-C6 fungal-type domain-containing protein n=1 Tax=Amylocarpus encephaloides TaxID=45428 RepID=A0A9P7YK71_9HELO|nr:hypothetical protein BJ875DRAFT_423692 [Amylocarpus encephaloides]